MFKENTFYRLNVENVAGFNNASHSVRLTLKRNDIILVTKCIKRCDDDFARYRDVFLVSLIFDFKQYKIEWSDGVKNYFNEIT
jgi:hypothetical protein